MTLRRQLPVHSPLPLAAVLAGGAGLVAGGGTAAADLTTALIRTFGAEAVVLTDSGTGALALAIGACLAGSPDAAVALPAFSCYDLATAAAGAGARVLLYDVSPDTLAPDDASLERALARGARIVVLAHLFGVPADPAPVRRTAEAAGAWLIEDAAQGAGAAIRRRPLGSFGDFSVLSFGRGKGNTSGRGGALLIHGARAATAAAGIRAGLLRRRRGAEDVMLLAAQWLLARPALYALPSALPFLRLGETVYREPEPARGLSAAAARVLAVTWPLGEAEGAVRKAHAARLLGTRARGLTPPRIPAAAEAGYLRLPLVASVEARSSAASGEARGLGIMPSYPKPLCDLAPFAERVLNRDGAFPGARLLAERLVTLPTHGLLDERDLTRLQGWMARH